MGAFTVSLWVGNIFTDDGASVEALVYTGATYSMTPGELAARPGH